MKKQKKWIVALIVLACVLSLCACVAPTPTQTPSVPTTTPSKPAAEPTIPYPVAYSYTKTNQRVIYEHVIIVGVDGAGSFFSQAECLNLNSIFSDGAITHTAITATPSSSAPCWGSMLLGVAPDVHGITNNSGLPRDGEDFPSIFMAVGRAFPDAKLASYVHWPNINTAIIEAREDLPIKKVSSLPDQYIASKGAQYILENKPTLMYLHFDDADAAGHSDGYGSAYHLQTLEKIDRYIGQIYQAIIDAGIADSTLFIVVSDHGGTPDGEHGGDTDAEMQILFAVNGSSVLAGGQISLNIQDVPAIVAYALGIDQLDTWNCTLPQNLFADNPNGDF
jgi:predicted AlkP superfamily phosphohydrolase/phosphomutase